MARPPLTPEQRALRASLAADARWGRTPAAERRDHGLRSQAGLMARFEAEVPDSVTDPAERARLAEQLRRSHMKKLALASSRARSRKAP
jgi:hypothetical protein